MNYKLKGVLGKYIRGPFGSALKRGELKSEGIPVYEQQNAIYNHREFRYFVDNEKFEELKRFQVQTGDLIISCSGTLGKVSLISENDEKGIISQALLILRPNKELILPDYLYYFFKSDYGYKPLISRSSGSVQINLAKREVIEDIDLFVPEIKIQRKVVNILKNIDSKIKINTEINNNLYEISKQLLLKYLDDNRESEEININKLINVFTGKKNANETSPNGKYKFFSCAPESLLSDTYIYDGSAIIVAGNGAYTGRTRFYEGKFELYQRTYGLTLKDDINQNVIYGLYVFMKTVFEPDKMGGTHGSAIPYIVLSDLTDYKLKYNKIEFEKFSNSIANNIKMIQENEKENEKLSQLRDTLLPRLMNGEIN